MLKWEPERRAGEMGEGLMKVRTFVIHLVLGPLLLLLASSLVLAYSGVYYVIPPSASLLDCPDNGCPVVLTVYRGDQVEILERTGAGWSRVRLAEQSGLGWIRSDQISYSPDLKAKPVPPYHVNISNVTLRNKPTPNSEVITTLRFNDPVEMLGVGLSGWAQVRDLQSSLVGWVDPRYLSATPLDDPQEPSRRRAPARKAAPKEKKTPTVPRAM
jgi:hypothetical protein